MIVNNSKCKYAVCCLSLTVCGKSCECVCGPSAGSGDSCTASRWLFLAALSGNNRISTA